MGLIGFIVIIIILGVLFDDKLGTTMATGGLQLLFGIGHTVVCFCNKSNTWDYYRINLF